MLQTDQRFPRAGSQSYPSPAAEANADGSTTVYFAPTKPAGVKDGNWIETVPGKGWFVILRLYSPLEPFFAKTWRPSEIEPVTRDAPRTTLARQRAEVAPRAIEAASVCFCLASPLRIASATGHSRPRGDDPSPCVKRATFVADICMRSQARSLLAQRPWCCGPARLPRSKVSIEGLLKAGWQIAGYASAVDDRSTFILLRNPSATYLVQCRSGYDVTRSPRVYSNCYELR